MTDQTIGPEHASKSRVIKQLMLATNFGAVFVDQGESEPWVDTILAWALVSSSAPDGSTSDSVVGLVADGKDVVFVDEFPNFVGYLSPDSSLDEWRKRLADRPEPNETPENHSAYSLWTKR